MTSFGNTLYAAMLQRRAQQQQLDQQRQLEDRRFAEDQRRFDLSREDQQFQNLLSQGKASEEAKNAEFERQYKVASLLGEQASRRGVAMPTNFGSPALMEAAQVGYGSGETALEAEERKRQQEILLRQLQEQAALERAGMTTQMRNQTQMDIANAKIAQERDKILLTQSGSLQSPLTEEFLQTQGPVMERWTGVNTPVRRAPTAAEVQRGMSQPDYLGKMWDRRERHMTTKATNDTIMAYNGLQSFPDTGPGDIGMVMAFAKMVDPGSRVTDKDFQLTAQSGGYAEGLRGWWEEWQAKGRLTAKTRSQILQAAKHKLDAQLRVQQAFDQQIGAFAQGAYGVQPGQFLPNMSAYPSGGTEPAPDPEVLDLMDLYEVPR